jgi:hypothetical protein
VLVFHGSCILSHLIIPNRLPNQTAIARRTLLSIIKTLQCVGGGEKVCHFAGQKGAGGVVSRWPIAGAPQEHYVYDGLSSEGFTCGAR